MTPFAVGLQKAAGRLLPERDDLVASWTRALAAADPGRDPDLRSFCERGVDSLLGRLSRGEAEDMLREEATQAASAAASRASFLEPIRALRELERCCLLALVRTCPDPDELSEGLAAMAELGARRLEGLLRAHEQEAARRVGEAEDHTARAQEKLVELQRANDGLRRSAAQSQHRAEQIGLLSSVVHRIAPLLDSERLMQEAADTIQARMSYTYVAVVVLDGEGMLVGRWAGRHGVNRRSAGRTQGPAGGVIGRTLRKRAPQVVPDVRADPDYHPDVDGTQSEMVIPILEEGEVTGAIDFQSERPADFDLDDVAVGETLAEFLVVALRNARLFAEVREQKA